MILKINHYKYLFILTALFCSAYNKVAAQNLFAYKINNKWGVYNNLGEKKISITKDYYNILEFKDGMALFQNTEWMQYFGYINEK